MSYISFRLWQYINKQVDKIVEKHVRVQIRLISKLVVFKITTHDVLWICTHID